MTSEPTPFEQPCPIRDVLDRIGDQWSLLVLEALSEKTWRFNTLQREIGDVSKQMLSKTLRRLEQSGICADGSGSLLHGAAQYLD